MKGASTAAWRSVWYILGFWGLWQVSGAFEVAPNVSGFYPGPALSIAFIAAYGVAYVPAVFVAAVLGSFPFDPFWDYDSQQWWQCLRQAVVYGLAGACMRHLCSVAPVIRNGADVRTVLMIGVLATFASSVLAVIIFWSHGFFPTDALPAVFFSFWAGDGAGVLMTLPLFHFLIDALKTDRLSALLRGLPRRPPAVYGLFTLGPALGAGLGFAATVLGEQGTQYGYIILLPVVWLAARGGVYGGLLAALVANIVSVVLYGTIDGGRYPTVELQVLFAVTASIGMVVGVAFDELRDHEAAKREAEVEILTQRLRQQELQRLAFHDAVTDLPTRRLVMDRLDSAVAAARRADTLVAVLFIDLDGFKQVNDTLGHEAGDRLLRQVGGRLKECVRETDTVGRIGGDEFVLVLTGLNQPYDAALVADKVVRTLALDAGALEAPLIIGASVGVALFPQDSEQPDRLIKLADGAMYQAKRHGKGCHVFASGPETRAAGLPESATG